MIEELLEIEKQEILCESLQNWLFSLRNNLKQSTE